MNNPNKENTFDDSDERPHHQPLEDLLRRLSLSEPSDELDHRVQKLLRPKPRRWTGPAWGFAAGVLATACVMGAMSLTSRPPSQSPAPVAQPAAHAPGLAAPNERMLSVLIEPHRQVRQYAATIDGVPVTLERTDLQYLIWPAGGGGTPTRVDVPEASTVHQVIQY